MKTKPNLLRFFRDSVCIQLAVTSVVAIAALLFTAAPALADRSYDTQITELPDAFGITVDYSDSLWVANSGNNGQISEYGPFSSNLVATQNGSGAGEQFSAYYNRSVALDDLNGYLYVANSDTDKLDVFENGTGPLIEQWGGFGGGFVYAAIDNSGGTANGTVYVAASGPKNIQAFDANHSQANFSALDEPYIAGNRITGTPNGTFGFIRNIAVDSNGNIYLVDQEKSEVDEFKPSGEYVRSFKKAELTTPTAVAVDPTNANVLIAEEGGGVIDEFTSSGEFLAQINGSETPAGSFSPAGISFNSEGYLYVSDSAHEAVDLFTPNVPLPKISYEPPSNLKQTSVTLNAKVDPNGGEVTGCYFEYGVTAAYGSPHVPCSPEPPYSGTAETNVSAEISGLTSETAYHYRVVVTAASGHPRRGGDQTFTLHAVANLATEPATALTPTGATLNASFLGNGEDTHYYFEWGTTTSYGNQTTIPPGEDAGSPSGPTPTGLSFHLTGLEPATTYHYRVVAENGAGTTTAGDRT